MTPDINRLRRAMDKLRQPLDEIEFEYVDDPAWPEPSDASYLNDTDRADPEIMDNVDAMAATNQLIAWFGKDDEGYIGLWRSSAQWPIEQCPVVRLDTEGQYTLIAATVPDYITISVQVSSFEMTRKALMAEGFTVSSSLDGIRDALGHREEPNQYRNGLYNQGRIRRGLKPV